MPTYRYVCTECEEAFERRLRISQMEEPLKKPCPYCGKESLRRSIENPQGLNTDPLPKLKPEFRETMQKIKKANPHNVIPDY